MPEKSGIVLSIGLSVPLMFTFVPALTVVITSVLVAVPIQVAVPGAKVELDNGSTVKPLVVARDIALIIDPIGPIAGVVRIISLGVYVSGKTEEADSYCQ